MKIRDIKVVYVPPVCTAKLVRGGEMKTWEDLQTRLLEANVPGVTKHSYIELLYPQEGFVCPLASEALPDVDTFTVSVHIELTGSQARQLPAYSEPVTGEPIYVVAGEKTGGEGSQKLSGEAKGEGSLPAGGDCGGVECMRPSRRKEGKLKHREEKMVHKLEKISAKLEGLRMKQAEGNGEGSPPPRGCRPHHHHHHHRHGRHHPHRHHHFHGEPPPLPPHMAEVPHPGFPPFMPIFDDPPAPAPLAGFAMLPRHLRGFPFAPPPHHIPYPEVFQPTRPSVDPVSTDSLKERVREEAKK